MTILLVEPDRVLGQTAKTALEAFGHTVVWKKTAQTALDALDENIPEVLVLEPQLGVHNGVELLYEIASYPEWKHIPVVLYTLNSRVQNRAFQNALKQLKVEQVLYKPETTAVRLVNVVKQFA